jgi:hypothetical protein
MDWNCVHRCCPHPEWNELKAFDAAIQKHDCKAAITEALNTMVEKQKAYQAFGERVS